MGPELRSYFPDLNRETFGLGGDYWATFRVKETRRSPGRPHGLQYALTMHSPGDGRIVGYDNAHLPQNLVGARKANGDLIVEWDHRHFRDGDATHYVFMSPERLLEDFWRDVNRILKEEGVSG